MSLKPPLIVGSYRMLVDLESTVDRTDSKLGSAMRRMRKFIRQTEGRFIVIMSPLNSDFLRLLVT